MKNLKKNILTVFSALIVASSLLVLTSCGSSSSSDTNVSAVELRNKEVAELDATRVGLMESLAKLYPNGQLPADQQTAASKLLMQNPSVFRSSAAGSTAKAQVFAGVAADFSPVYRIQNTTLYGSYFFTIYDSEKTSALGLNPDWKLEGPAFYASPAAATDLSPVYRFRNKVNGSYVFSIDEGERNSINTTYADTFAEEGVAWYARKTPADGFTELYRFRNKTNGTYLFTAYASEKQSIIDSYPDIFVYEGVAYYVQVTAAGAAYTGTVIDGYIKGATVFWDCNGNRQFDANEVFAVTNTEGRFLISDSPAAACELVAYVGIGAIDSDNPTAVITSPYTLLAASGRPDIITPLTTMVAGVLTADPSMSLAAAESKVTVDFKLTASPLANYMPNSINYSLYNKGISKFIAQNLSQTTETNAFTLNTVYSTVKSQAATPSFLSSIQGGYLPFVFNKNSLLDYYKINVPVANTNNIAILTDHTDTSDNLAYMQTIADKITLDGRVQYGIPHLEVYDQATLKNWMLNIQSKKIGETKPNVGALIETFRTDRQTKLNALSKTLDDIVDHSPNRLDIFTDSGDATFDYVFQSASAIIAVQVDVVDVLYTNGKLNHAGNIARKNFNLVKYTEKVNVLKKTIEKLGIAVDSVGCVKDLTIYLNTGNDDSAKDAAARDALKSCKDFIGGLSEAFMKLKKHKEFSTVVLSSADMKLLSTNDFSKLDSFAKTTAYWKNGIDTFDAVIDLINMMDVPPGAGRVIASIDIVRQCIGMYVNARELEDAVIGVKQEAIIEYEKQTQLVFSEYFAKYLGAYSWYFTVVDKTKDIYVKSALSVPTNAAFGQQIVFTVDGGNIPLSSSLTATLGGNSCVIGASSTPSRLLVTCTPSGTQVGSQNLSIKVGANEIVGAPFAVNVTNSAAGASIDLPATSFLRGLNVALSTDGGNGPDTLMNAPPYVSKPNVAEWDFSVPTSGSYELFATYAAEQSRPVTISFNGAVAFSNALSATTGAWIPTYRQTISQGIVQLTAGSKTMRVERNDVFPHIKGFVLVPVTTGNFAVPANLSSGTAFTIPPGATSCLFNTSGSWMYSVSSTTSADGDASLLNNINYPRLLGTASYFSLIAGTNNGYISIGTTKTVNVIAGSTMLFQINEGIGIGDSYADNSGALTVGYACQ